VDERPPGPLRVRPADRLQPYVTSYIEFDMVGWPPGRHRGLPDGSLTMVVSIGAPPIVRCPGLSDLSAVATVGGLRADPVDIVHDGTQRGVQLELTPLGARALLGVPAAALAHGAWPLDEVVGRRAGELVDRLLEARGPAERARALDHVLASWVRDVEYPPMVDAAWCQLAAAAGSVSVTRVADEVGLSRRHLSEIVRAELGLTPKTVARIFRFGHACRTLLSGRTTSLAETAVASGYFDQSHLTNDWKQLAGCTPGEWMAEELPFLQDRHSAEAGS
jgi:AraC-like DNA-binding protein